MFFKRKLSIQLLKVFESISIAIFPIFSMPDFKYFLLKIKDICKWAMITCQTNPYYTIRLKSNLSLFTKNLGHLENRPKLVQIMVGKLLLKLIDTFKNITFEITIYIIRIEMEATTIRGFPQLSTF